MQFVNGRVLAAHNAEFDISFIRAGCRKVGLEFEPTYIDSLILAQNLLPELHKYKLDIVAEHLTCPPSTTTGRRTTRDGGLYAGSVLRENAAGVGYFPFAGDQRGDGEAAAAGRGSRHPKHIIILAKNKLGLKHLYQLVSASNLKYFKRYPSSPRRSWWRTGRTDHRLGLRSGRAVPGGGGSQGLGGAERIASFYDYLEIQPICNNMFMLRNGTVQSEE